MGLAACVAQEADGFGGGVLLARETCYKTTAADFATGFQAPVTHEQVAPWWQPVGLAGQQAPEYNSPAFQQCAGDVLDGFLVLQLLCGASGGIDVGLCRC